ncbi:MAG: ABC transporter substrate-binding protein [Gammaproteobacteria bacterium]|nr:ABC transporter substrate-binding protein [Gammaproteobacteria bacterium]
MTSRAFNRAGTRVVTAIALVACLLALGAARAEDGVTDQVIRTGGVMDLEGLSRGLGLGMRSGIEAAFRNERPHGRRIDFITRNDSYTPKKTIEATEALINQGVFAMIGNVGTPTARVSLPILAREKVPAVGFFTGAGILRPGEGDIINFRASYVQETAAVIRSAIDAGVSPGEICAFVQNDSYGMAGVVGIKLALGNLPGTEALTSALDAVLAQEGEDPPRNNLGPVGVYQRNTMTSREGYRSLKTWENRTNTRCRVVVTVGTYGAIANFAAYARYKRENWIVSAVSFTGADDFHAALTEARISDKVIMTQVVPLLDSDIPIVREARQKLGDQFGWVSLEGFIVGKLFLFGLNRVQGEVTRAKFLDAIRGRIFDLGGLKMDFSTDNQGSDLVVLTHLTETGFDPMPPSAWRAMLR